VVGCLTKLPCGGRVARRSPVDRAKQGGKRSLAVDAGGIPLGVAAAPANRRDDGPLAQTLETLDPLGPLPDQPVAHRLVRRVWIHYRWLGRPPRRPDPLK
jgi:hypothetical protein